ncbi:10081_t:CDS:2 [Acaulospora morrowiae]|uniref:10081_t:CDS:1 n=1 Tax=Acaulospora morrowiae TaxID=94023 RepID=A0A9N9BDN2_9GLOM|nr:10081_t:CDS:2 [Acaulospora morrowiae]
MATLYRNDTDTDSIVAWRSMTLETATPSSTSISSIEETDEIKKYRYFWWKTGNIHPKARWEKATKMSRNFRHETGQSAKNVSNSNKEIKEHLSQEKPMSECPNNNIYMSEKPYEIEPTKSQCIERALTKQLRSDRDILSPASSEITEH